MRALALADRTDALPAASRPGRRFYDCAEAAWITKVMPGEFHVAADRQDVLVTILGSCVAACIRDPAFGIGGMNHFMLAEGRAGEEGAWDGDLQSARYGQFAMEKLINALLKRGCARKRLEVKVFGGANVTTARNAVGSKNAEFVMRYLDAEGLSCAARDLGGVHPRRILYYPATGKVSRRLLTGTDQDVAIRDERCYAATLRPRDGGVQLFR